MVAVTCAALVAVGVIIWSYWYADHQYNKLSDAAVDTSVMDTPAAASDEELALAGMKVDWAYLRSVNPDVVAWIYVPGTPIDYPVVHTTDDSTYLHQSFDGGTGISASSGTIFLEADDTGTFSDQNNIMYGHHMNNGSMFACLSKQFTDEDEFNADRTIYVFTPTMNYKCQSFALVLTDGSDTLAQTSFATPADMASYIADKESRSVVQPTEGMPDPTGIDKLFTLATCDYTQSNGRAILFARVVLAVPPAS